MGEMQRSESDGKDGEPKIGERSLCMWPRQMAFVC